jgi:molybdopterin molybdotransferase
VTILATGDELRAPGRAARPGSIPDSVSLGVAAMARVWGAEVCGLRRLRDALCSLERAAAEAVAGSDLVVVTGGASVGDRDFAKAMFGPLGLDLVFPKVAIKPGKPVWFGRVAGKLVLGLPGNPTAALLTARLFLAPLICGLNGRGASSAWSWRRAPLAGPLEGCGDRETFYRGRAVGGAVAPLADQDSSAQKALAASDVIIRRQPGDGIGEVQALVSVLDL